MQTLEEMKGAHVGGHCLFNLKRQSSHWILRKPFT